MQDINFAELRSKKPRNTKYGKMREIILRAGSQVFSINDILLAIDALPEYAALAELDVDSNRHSINHALSLLMKEGKVNKVGFGKYQLNWEAL